MVTVDLQLNTETSCGGHSNYPLKVRLFKLRNLVLSTHRTLHCQRALFTFLF